MDSYNIYIHIIIITTTVLLLLLAEIKQVQVYIHIWRVYLQKQITPFLNYFKIMFLLCSVFIVIYCVSELFFLVIFT